VNQSTKTLMYPLRSVYPGRWSRARSLVGWVRVDLIGVAPTWWLGPPFSELIGIDGREWR
jgi:hypothetical protein